MSGRRKMIVVALVAVVAVGVGAGVWFYHRWHERPSDTLVLQGNVDVREVDLAFEVPGRIESLAVDEGDTVKAGQVVATLDRGYFEDAVRESRAALGSRKAELARLRNGSRPEEIEQARAAAAERRVAVENARRDVKRSARGCPSAGTRRPTRRTGRCTNGRTGTVTSLIPFGPRSAVSRRPTLSMWPRVRRGTRNNVSCATGT